MADPGKPQVDLGDLRIEDSRRAPRGAGWVWLLLLILVPAAFVAGWYLRGQGGAEAGDGTLAVRVAVVSLVSESVGGEGFSEGGWIEVPSYHPILVSALVEGRVEELLVLEGSRVEKDQVVARLYGSDLEDALRKAEAEVAEAKASLTLFQAGYRIEEVRGAEADYRRLEEEVKLAELILARTRRLLPSGAASAEDLERHTAALEVAKARLQAAGEDLGRLQAGFREEEIEKARATLSRTEATRDLARARLSYAEVRSPAAGVVLERFVTPGSWLSADDPRVIALYDPTDLQARVDVRQENAGQILVGQQVGITTQAEPGRSYKGQVIRVEPLADFKKNTVQAKIRILDPGPGLHPEMICRARFAARDAEVVAGAAPGRIAIPRSSVLEERGANHVFLVRDGRALRVPVELGEEQRGRVEVRSGLSPGDRYVLQPPPGLADGARVSEVER